MKDETKSSLIAQYFLNHRLDRDEIRWQMQEFARAGYQGVFAHAREGLRTPYMSEAWWEAIDTIIEMCRQLGMEFWIWDEDYFPSGLAGGRIVWEEPGLISLKLDFTIIEQEGAGPFEMDCVPGMLLRAFALEKRPNGTFGEMLDLTSFCGTRRQSWTTRQIQHLGYSPSTNLFCHPHWRCDMIDNRFALFWTPPHPGKYLIVAVLTTKGIEEVRPDMLRGESVRHFIEMTHEKYFQRYGSEFGKVVKGSFTDEPCPGCASLYPWTPAFPQEFHKDYNYDLLPYLAHLLVDIDELSPVIRHHYRLTQHRLQRENYTGQLGRWCEEHGISFTGHLSRTEWLTIEAYIWPNQIRCYQPMHIPCADPLNASQGWKENAAHHSGLKVVSSAAHLFGRAQCGSDALAVAGDEASIRDLKYLCDYHMVLGINYFSVHGLHYSIDGPRKDEVPPSLFYQHTEWKHMPVLLEHVRKTCETLTGGEHLCEIAVLYPSTSLGCQAKLDIGAWYLPDENLIHSLSEQLLNHQRDFDFIDELTFQESVNNAGKLTAPEVYRVILLPYLRFIDEQTAGALLRFARAGGQVIAIGFMPRALTRDFATPQRSWADASINFLPVLDNAAFQKLPGIEVEGEGANDVFVLRRRKDGSIYTFVFNRREKEFIGSVDGFRVNVPPQGSILLTTKAESRRPAGRPVATSTEIVADWSSGWAVEFEPNHIPLNFWHVSGVEGLRLSDVAFSGRAFDLMARQPDPAPVGEEPVRYSCRFLLTGEVADAWLVMEDSTIAGGWELFVNDRLIENWQRARVYDCYNIKADIQTALRIGTTPTVNIITIETRGPGRGLKEVLYLYGSFTCEYRYGHLSFPFVKGAKGSRMLANLQPWGVLGYPTFSGSALYQRTIKIPKDTNLVLDLGRVEDIAVVNIDGHQVAVLAWPPYLCSLGGIAPGVHELTVEVTNSPANRNRAAGLPAGILGPVNLLRE